MTAPVRSVVVMAGGTGGHVFPALAVAEALRARGIRIHWLGTRAGIEAELVPARHFDISYLDVSGVRGQGVVRLLLAPFKIVRAVLAAMRVLRAVEADCVIGLGGYVTGPGGVAARLLGKPLLIHEQNAVAGFTNRMLSRMATRVLEAFPGAFPASSKVSCVGNPVRADIAALPIPELRFAGREGSLRVLVMGGSQGAVALNELVPLFDGWRVDAMPMYVAFPPNRHVSAKLRAFIDWVVELMAVHAPLASRPGKPKS